MNKKILILGGEGFIGRNLAKLLSEKYACFSAGVKKSTFLKRKDKFIKKNPYREKIENNYDVIIHLIDNKADIEKFSGEEEKLIKNIGLNKKNHLIVFSSAAVYANPDSKYGKRKIKLEKIYIDYCAKNKINLTTFRLFNIYGPYQIPNVQGSLIANIFCNYLNGKKTEINDMNAKRDFIFSENMARFVEYSITDNFYGRTDLATGESIAIKNLIEKIKQTVGDGLIIEDGKNKENIFCALAKNRLAGKIKLTPMRKSLEKTLQFYKNNLKLINEVE